MASKANHLLLALSFLFLLYLPHTVLSHISSFEFVKSLQGLKREDKKEGISKLRDFLHRFGYLSDEYLHSESFDEELEVAVKTYQLNFNLKPTGVLDNETVSAMMRPRCGVPDIINGTTRMNAAGNYSMHYAFFPGSPVWDARQLSWRLLPGSRQDAIKPIKDYALVTWTGASPFQFPQVDSNAEFSYIQIGFHPRNSDPVFEGPEGVLGYAYAPQNGTMFLNSDVNWAINGPLPEAIDMGTVALHELGHILGLAHSSDPGAIMFPTIPVGSMKGLGKDDIEAMKVLYKM